MGREGGRESMEFMGRGELICQIYLSHPCLYKISGKNVNSSLKEILHNNVVTFPQLMNTTFPIP